MGTLASFSPISPTLLLCGVCMTRLMFSQSCRFLGFSLSSQETHHIAALGYSIFQLARTSSAFVTREKIAPEDICLSLQSILKQGKRPLLRPSKGGPFIHYSRKGSTHPGENLSAENGHIFTRRQFLRINSAEKYHPDLYTFCIKA